VGKVKNPGKTTLEKESQAMSKRKQTTSKQDFPTLESILIHYPEVKGIHPANEALPKFKRKEQALLNRDIADNGLMDEIVLTKDGQLLDGRHRLIACFLENVEPRFKILTGSDYWTACQFLNHDSFHLSFDDMARFNEMREKHRLAEIKERKAAESKAT